MNYKTIYHESRATDPGDSREYCAVECYQPTDNTQAPPLLHLKTIEPGYEDPVDNQWRLMCTTNEPATIREAIAQFDQYYKLQGGKL